MPVPAALAASRRRPRAEARVGGAAVVAGRELLAAARAVDRRLG